MSLDCSTMLVKPCNSLASKSSLVSTSSQSPRKLHQLPLLVFPIHDNYSERCCLYNHVDSKASLTNMWGDNNDQKIQNSRCIGSSKGWLVVHQTNENSESFLSLFSPLSITPRKIVIPSYKRPINFEISWIRKSILTLNPVQSGYKFGVVFLYGISCYNKVALLMMHDVQDDENKWIDLKASYGHYADVVSNQESLFALSISGYVEVWNLRSASNGGSIDKTMNVKTSYIGFDHLIEYGDKFRELYTTKFYLVESQGNLFLSLRVIGEFVRDDGEVVNAGALRDDEVYSHLVLPPYKTKNFYVYKLDWGLKKWVEVDSLGDRILFVGLNESMSFSPLDIQGCQGNSIYFTDDNWDHINIYENEMCGGHDMGIFSLCDRNVKQIFETKRKVPPPVWVDLDISGV